MAQNSEGAKSKQQKVVLPLVFLSLTASCVSLQIHVHGQTFINLGSDGGKLWTLFYLFKYFSVMSFNFFNLLIGEREKDRVRDRPTDQHGFVVPLLHALIG